VLKDDPNLTVRFIKGKRKNPLRVILDSDGKTAHNYNLKIFSHDANTLLFISSESKVELASFLKLEARYGDFGKKYIDIREVLSWLWKLGVMSVLVEGGSEVAWSFIYAGVVDEIFLFVAPKIFGGRLAPGIFGGVGFIGLEESLKVSPLYTMRIGEDILVRGGICSQVLWKI
jgi:riboflavin-specific deaminase-like protein